MSTIVDTIAILLSFFLAQTLVTDGSFGFPIFFHSASLRQDGRKSISNNCASEGKTTILARVSEGHAPTNARK
jgi:hypothetical protein